MFSEATQNKYMISYDEYFIERRVLLDLLVQHDVGSSQKVKSPKFLISAHQTKDRILIPNKNNKIAIFDNLDLREYYVELDGQRCPKDGISKNYTENNYIDQYSELKLFFIEYIGEPILNPLISYPDMRTKYSIGFTDLRLLPDCRTTKKIQLFQEYGSDPDNARLFPKIVRRRQIELTSDGIKLIEVEVIEINTLINL